VPVLTALLGAGLLVAAILLWRHWTKLPEISPVREPLQYCVLSFILFLSGLLLGSFLVGSSREPAHRWLRPGGAWLYLAGGMNLLAGLALLATHWGVKVARLDLRAGRIGLIALMILAAEMILSVIIEFYRPRTAGEEDRPVFESRLLALFTEPGGLVRNLAVALDYQFGFRVSDVWFYRFLERTLAPFVLAMLALLWLTTCVVVIQTEENGIRERFGRVASEKPLPPGFYLKLPWPLARIYTFPVERVQVIPIGFKVAADKDAAANQPPPDMEEMGDMTGRVIIWAKKHHAEETDFVVASRPSAEGAAGETPPGDPDRLPVSVYLMTASVPLYFRVNNLYDYAYRHTDARATLERVAMGEIVAYLVSVDFFDMLTARRAEGAARLRERIQAAAEAQQLGVEVVFVGLQGVHPPVKVGKAFNEVVSASEAKHTEVLNAEKEAVRRIAESEGDAVRIGTEARAYTYERVQTAEAEAARFLEQMAAYRASPELYPLRTYLDVLETEARDTRKFIIGTDRGSETVIINLEEKLRKDLLDIDLERKN